MKTNDILGKQKNSSKKQSRSFDDIYKDICGSLGTIDQLASYSGVVPASKEGTEKDAAFLMERRRKVLDMNIQLRSLKKMSLSLKEKGQISQEVIDETSKTSGPLDAEKVEIVLGFIGAPQKKNDIDPTDKDAFIHLLQAFIKDCKSQAQKVSCDMTSLEDRLSREEESYFSAESDFLRKKIKKKIAKNEKREEEKALFEKETKRLEQLEQELKLCIINEKTKSQIDDLRGFLRDK